MAKSADGHDLKEGDMVFVVHAGFREASISIQRIKAIHNDRKIEYEEEHRGYKGSRIKDCVFWTRWCAWHRASEILDEWFEDEQEDARGDEPL